jgi:Amt family ammonium transporter
MRKNKIFLLLIILLLTAQSLFAEDKAILNTGDTAWMIVATALVMFMTPVGLALFYGGMTRYKNMLNTFTLSFVSYALGCTIWIFWGYSLAFGNDINGIIGNLSNIFLKGIHINQINGTIPTYIFIVFQMTFAAITLALISGAIVERMKFSSWIIFSILWLTFIYSPICHWVWGGGFIGKMGALDFAGGTVVHINAGVSGLVLALMLGKRKGYGKEAIFPSSVLLTAAGAAMLLFGWFGFNAGSELKVDGISASAFLVTNTAACIGALTWMCAEWIKTKKPTLLGIASGLVAGLVAITPAAGFVDLTGSIIIGIGAGIFGYIGVVIIKPKFGYDDSLDAFGVHGLCGIWGAIATGLFANPNINEIGKGLFYGNPKQLWIQILSVIITIVYSVIGTFILAYITKLLTKGIRVEEDVEIEGLDSAVHGERAFLLR